MYRGLVHPCSKVIGIVFAMSNDAIFSLCMIRSLAFVVENIISVWYTVTLGWAFKFGKVRNMRCQYSATWIKKMATFSCCTAWYILMSDFSVIIDTNYILVTNCYFFRHILFYGEIHYSNIKPGTSSYTIPCDADVWSGEREPAHMK